MQKSLLACLLLIVVNVIVFGQVYTFDFIGYDDKELVFENPALLQESVGAGIREAFRPYFANWIPVTTLTYVADHALYDFDPSGYHVTNLIFHTLNTLLVFLVFRYLTGQFWFGLGMALLFALHPSRVEVVAWVSERKGLVSTTFLLASVWTYAAYTRSESRKVILYAATMALLAMSLMAKSMAVTLPFVFLLLDGWPLGRHGDCAFGSKEHRATFWKLCVEKVPFLLLVVGSSIVTSLSQGDSGAVASLNDVTASMRATNVFYGYGSYLVHLVWPVDLIPFYPHLGDALPLWRPVLGLLAVVLITILVTMQIKRRPYLMVGWCWFLGMLVPVIGIVQVGAQAYADRYLYVPLLGIGIMVFGALSEWMHQRGTVAKGVVASCAVLIGAFGYTTWITTSYWEDDIWLFSYVIEVDEENVVGHTILGEAYLDRDNFEKSRVHLERALELDADHPDALKALGTLYIRENGGDADESDDQIQNNLGASYLMRKEYDRAEVHLQRALELNPENVSALTNLAIVRFEQGDREEAVQLVTTATELDPGYENAQKFLDYIRGN